MGYLKEADPQHTVIMVQVQNEPGSWYSVRDYSREAGKAVNPLPMYVNVALRDPLANLKPNQYESGGATDNVIPIWKAAAPSIGLLAPMARQLAR